MEARTDISAESTMLLQELLDEVRALRSGERLREEETPLTLQDVLDRVPWSRPTVMKMIERRQIPMVKVEGKWVISRSVYREALERGFEVPRGLRIKKRSRT